MVNKVTLIGRLGKDPEKKTLPSGASYVRFSLASNESYKDKEGNWKDQTEWHNIIMWRDMADRAEKQLKKGSLVFLEGKLTTQQWQDQDGKPQSRTEVHVNMFRSLEKSENSGGGYIPAPPPMDPMDLGSKNINTPKENPVDESDDLPF